MSWSITFHPHFISNLLVSTRCHAQLLLAQWFGNPSKRQCYNHFFHGLLRATQFLLGLATQFLLGLAMSGYKWPLAFNLVYLHFIFLPFGLVFSIIMYFCVFLKVDFVESSATSPPRVSFVPSFLYFTMEQAWEATAFVSFLLVFFPGLMFFGSGFGKSQLCNSVSNLGLSFSFLISFFCNRTWRCWRFYNRTLKILWMGNCVFFWVYGHVLFKVHNLATLFQLLLITLSLCFLQIESMRSCCIWDIVIQNE